MEVVQEDAGPSWLGGWGGGAEIGEGWRTLPSPLVDRELHPDPGLVEVNRSLGHHL